MFFTNNTNFTNYNKNELKSMHEKEIITQKYFSPLLTCIKKGQVNIFEEYLQNSHESIIQTFNSLQINENLLQSSGLVKLSAS